LYTIATRLCINYQKKCAPSLDNEILATLVAKETMTQDNDLLWQKAKQLPDDQYTVLLLKYAEELSLKDISIIVEKPIGTIKVLLHRARQSLAKTLQPHDLFVH